jgi:cell wall-associated NlpC family hydrolase
LGQRTAAPDHLAAADELVKRVAPANSSYEHKQGSVSWKGSDGATQYECHTDCSGLMNHLLAHCYGINAAQLRGWMGSGRPTAQHYYRAIAAGNGYTRIEQLVDARPGDIIAVKYPKGSENSGHVMIVARPPSRRTSTLPLINGTEQWEVAIIDSSTSGHGKNDTRHRPDGGINQGIGSGGLRVYTDSQGRIVGYTWSTASGSEFRRQDERPMEIGRLASDKLTGH